MSKIVLAISGKTCSGKTFLLNQLLATGKFNKLVTSTTRFQREGEKEGLDYHFIQSSHAEFLIDAGKFIEYNVYGNQVYGLTEIELNDKLAEGKIPCVILTPNGVDAYKKLLFEKFGIRVISVFIDCPQQLLIDRLAKRVLAEETIDFEVLRTTIDRAISVALHEQGWKSYLEWDLVLNSATPNLDEQLINFTKQFSN